MRGLAHALGLSCLEDAAIERVSLEYKHTPHHHHNNVIISFIIISPFLTSLTYVGLILVRDWLKTSHVI